MGYLCQFSLKIALARVSTSNAWAGYKLNLAAACALLAECALLLVETLMLRVA